jgi:hypothetical protein
VIEVSQLSDEDARAQLAGTDAAAAGAPAERS